jgi:predicted O-methyltransferase YrrM
MDVRFEAVLDYYHDRIHQERVNPSPMPEGGRDGGNDYRMRAVGRQTGELLNVLARNLEQPNILEIGTSFGYSGLWLADAARQSGGQMTTLEMHAYKSEFAKTKHEEAGLAQFVDYKIGDALEHIEKLDIGIDFILLDLWKDMYVPCLEAFYPKLNPGAIIVADNIIRPGGDSVKAYVKAVRVKQGINSVTLPVGTGLEISRYEP